MDHPHPCPVRAARLDGFLSPTIVRTVEPTVVSLWSRTVQVPSCHRHHLGPPGSCYLRGGQTPPRGGRARSHLAPVARTPLPLQGSGGDSVTIDGRTAVSDLPEPRPGGLAVLVALTAGCCTASMSAGSVRSSPPTGLSPAIPGIITLGWKPRNSARFSGCSRCRPPG